VCTSFRFQVLLRCDAAPASEPLIPLAPRADDVWIRARTFSIGQAEEIIRVCRIYPHLPDDDFVKEHLNEWLN
jgi:hypothetical protein